MGVDLCTWKQYQCTVSAWAVQDDKAQQIAVSWIMDLRQMYPTKRMGLV